MLDTFVIPHIRDLEDQRYFQRLDIATAETEDLSRAISMVTQLPKVAWNPIFARNLRDNYASTLLRVEHGGRRGQLPQGGCGVGIALGLEGPVPEEAGCSNEAASGLLVHQVQGHRRPLLRGLPGDGG